MRTSQSGTGCRKRTEGKPCAASGAPCWPEGPPVAPDRGANSNTLASSSLGAHPRLRSIPLPQQPCNLYLDGPYALFCFSFTCWSWAAPPLAAQRHGITPIRDDHGLFCADDRISWSCGFRDCAIQTAERQRGEQYLDCLIHRGSLQSVGLDAPEVYAEVGIVSWFWPVDIPN